VCKTKGCQQGAVIIADDLELPENITSIAMKVGKNTYSLYAAKPASLTDCPRCGMPIVEAKPPKKVTVKPVEERKPWKPR